jgi:hypothetical protein
MGAVCPLAAHHGAESCLLGAMTAIASIAGMMLRCGNEVKGQVRTCAPQQTASLFDH